MKKNNIPDIPVEKFSFVGDNDRLHDQKLDTKKIGYLRDAFNRFCKNKSSVVAAIIIMVLIAYAVFVPMFCETSYSLSLRDTTYLNYTKLAPKNNLCVKLNLGFWDGSREMTLSEANLTYYQAIGQETGYEIIKEILEKNVSTQGDITKISYDARVDSYVSNGFTYMTLMEEEYLAIQQWQNETGKQIIFPAVASKTTKDPNIWYKINKKNVATLDKDGNLQPDYRVKGNDGNYDSLRIPGDPGLEDPTASDRYRYATITGDSSAVSYRCRVFLYNYFDYRYGFEPSFLFGTTSMGQDILTRLAAGARFSLLFAVCISMINMFIGIIYGAIEGYYGGMVDMLMERFSDILSRVPFMIVATLFQLHLASKVGAIPSLLFAFVLTGWIGIASTVRMQFYRYKGQEYVLASRVLGASDTRIMFRHIFPNSLGTLITSSVMIIPGVIFSESSLTYLGIVNLDSSTMTSVGTMLANARDYLNTYPHIILFPSIFISLPEIAFNLFGNGLRDAFNPSLRGADE